MKFLLANLLRQYSCNKLSFKMTYRILLLRLLFCFSEHWFFH